MAMRNRTWLFNKYRDALKGARAPTSSSAAETAKLRARSGVAPAIEMAGTSLLHSKRSYTVVSTEDPGNSRAKSQEPMGRFLQYKYNERSEDDEGLSTFCSKGAATIGLPPAWVDVSEEIATYVQRARAKMVELGKAHAKALMPSFGDGIEDQRNIENLTNEITNLLKRSEKRLQKLSATGPSEDSNVRKNVQRQLATDLQNLSMELRKKQSTYLKRLRQQLEEGSDMEMNLNGNRPKEEDDDLDDLMLNEYQMAKLKQSEAYTVEREREIQQASSALLTVVESVNELAQIMKDLSVLVIDQGTIIDRIDYNIQNVATTVEEGLKQLQKFAGRQNTETRRNGDVCFGACYYVLCHASPPNPKGDNLLIRKHEFFLSGAFIGSKLHLATSTAYGLQHHRVRIMPDAVGSGLEERLP
ncbi:hypothetical protein V6N13_088078 [Hibiscus sabdariffa]